MQTLNMGYERSVPTRTYPFPVYSRLTNNHTVWTFPEYFSGQSALGVFNLCRFPNSA